MAWDAWYSNIKNDRYLTSKRKDPLNGNKGLMTKANAKRKKHELGLIMEISEKKIKVK
ncbi:hypothetical protein SESBI_14137 [Sesbania bispinosa]|nr:hypothetical protein SESBI_14137 [Sesbania bispinosa]